MCYCLLEPPCVPASATGGSHALRGFTLSAIFYKCEDNFNAEGKHKFYLLQWLKPDAGGQAKKYPKLATASQISKFIVPLFSGKWQRPWNMYINIQHNTHMWHI